MDSLPSETNPPAPDAALLARLLADQAPHLAGLAVRPSPSQGSSNAVFRLGYEYAVRLPRSNAAADDLAKEVTWLPRLGPQFRVPTPEVVFAGRATDEFPRPWAVLTWLRGDNPDRLDADQQANLAGSLGEFLVDLHGAETHGMSGGSQWGYRCGEPVTDVIDAWADEVADQLSSLFNPRQVREAWSRVRQVPEVTGPPCWVHADLSAENLLVRPDGRLAGVIDFGCLGIGDRSIDFLYAWSMFDAPAREELRSAAEVDETAWLRARAWAFVGPGLVTIVHYQQVLPQRTAKLVAMVEAVAAEVGVSLR